MAWNEGTVNQMQQGEMTPSTAPETQPVRIWVRFLEAAIVTAAILWSASLVSGHTALGHDQSWYLYAAKQMLHGTALYGPHLEDSNPPLIYWITVVPVMAARITSLSISLSFFVFVVGLAALSSGWCYRLLREAASTPGRLQRLLFAAAIFFAELNVQRATDFGQREQFMVILVVPYLVAFGTARLRPLARGQVIALSVFAALGFCIKPQHLLTLFAAEIAIYLLFRDARRLASTQTLALGVIACIMAAYVAAIVIFFPQYPHHIMPVLQDTYWAFGQTPLMTLLGQRRLIAFVLLAALVLWRRWLPLSTMPAILLAACIGAHLAFAAQRTGWYYQQIPCNAFLALFGLWCFVELAAHLAQHRKHTARLPRAVALGFYAIAFFVSYLAITRIGNFLTPVPQTNDNESATNGFFYSLPPHTPVYVFAEDLIPAFPPVLDRDLVWASRAPHLLPLPAISKNEWAHDGGTSPGKTLPPVRLEELSSTLRANVTADLRYWRPTYVLVSVCDQGMTCEAIAPGFDILRWFERSPDFAATWSGYRFERTMFDPKRHARWDLYVLRSDMPATPAS